MQTKITHHLIHCGINNGVKILQLIQRVCSDTGGRLFYHLLHTGYDVSACVAESVMEHATKFSSSPPTSFASSS